MPNWKTYESAIRLLSAVVAANPDIKLNYQDISKAFGGDCTVSALENRFRRIKADAKSIRDALSEGIDPITLELASKGSKAIADLHGCGMNKKAAWDRLAPIRKDAQALKDALENGVDPTTVNIGARGRDGKQSVADQYGDGVTAKAVSNRFERVKKEPAWVGKGKANGKSTKAKNSDANGETGEELDEDASDDAEDFKTPTKNGKSLSRKVKEGRVTKKSTPRKNNGAGVAKDVAAMALSDKEEDQEMGIIKGEGGIHPDELLGFADGNGDFCNAGEELEDEA
ncbi:MAG: hypothetical protein M1818_008518 [Claussenomyces sp. TS43310]|nr:MAG: hypothetical protein M1818_008518 [Claussenomyces sp. TS43310]